MEEDTYDDSCSKNFINVKLSGLAPKERPNFSTENNDVTFW